jgi:hypothetical protein
VGTLTMISAHVSRSRSAETLSEGAVIDYPISLFPTGRRQRGQYEQASAQSNMLGIWTCWLLLHKVSDHCQEFHKILTTKNVLYVHRLITDVSVKTWRSAYSYGTGMLG